VKFCRINLLQTNYQQYNDAYLLSQVERDDKMEQLQDIYAKYCTYKKFTSVMPLFPALIFDRYTDVIGYRTQSKLVAFSLVRRYDQTSAESTQFAWDYSDPELKLGMISLEHECAYYKSLGFEHLYLGHVDGYKKQFDGYEELKNPYV
jgi:hypothetical protein